MNINQIIKIFGTDYEDMTRRLLDAADICAHIPGKSSRICLKPNLVAPVPAVMGATTHPEIARSVILYLRDKGYNNIFVAEGCWIGERTSACLEATGFAELCRQLDVPFYDVKKSGSCVRSCGGMDLNVSEIINDIDFLVNIPVLKGHCQVKMTCALKNLKGLVPDSEKRRFHAMGINEPLGHLAAGVRSDFIIVDNICGDLCFEDGGNPIKRNCIMAGLDPVLIDTYASSLMGLSPDDVPYIKIARQAGAGCANLEKAEIISLNESEYDRPFERSDLLLDVSFAAEAIDACSNCYSNLIPALLTLKEEGLLDKLDTKIAIGQNHRGRIGKLGVGNCTLGYKTCIRGCPPGRDAILQGLRAYIEKPE